MAANITNKMINKFSFESHMLRIDQLLEDRHRAIALKIKASPRRLVIAVIIPAPKDFGFW